MSCKSKGVYVLCMYILKSGNFNFKLSQRILELFPDFFELKLASGPQSFYRYGPEASINSKKSGKSSRNRWLNLKLKLPHFNHQNRIWIWQTIWYLSTCNNASNNCRLPNRLFFSNVIYLGSSFLQLIVCNLGSRY